MSEEQKIPGKCPWCGNESDQVLLLGHYVQAWHSECIEASREKKTEAAEVQRGVQWEDICPPLFRKTDLVKLKILNEGCVKALNWSHHGHGLLLTGPSGYGKTRCGYELLRRAFMSQRTVSVLTCSDLSSSSNEEYKHGRAAKWIAEFKHAGLLLIDDMGKECAGVSSVVAERIQNDLFTIINHRHEWQKPMIVTTNQDAMEIKKTWGAERAEALLRRLKEACEVITF